MAKQMTQEGLDFIKKKPLLYVEVAEMLKVEMAALAVYLVRKKTVFARYDILVKVASEMGVDPETLLEDVPKKELAKVG